MEEKFTQILDKDEKILKVVKPNKGRYMLQTLASFNLPLLLLLIVFIAAALYPNNVEEFAKNAWILGTFIGCLFVVGNIIAVVSVIYVVRNRFYAISNKRLIVRKGIMGIDFKCMDMSLIGLQSVKVSWLDKIYKKNTGSLSFGSLAHPISDNAGNFSFVYVEDPYTLYKEIKEKIEEVKDAKK